MKFRIFRPQKAPGFRLSITDVVIAAAALLASRVIAGLPGVGFLWPMPIHVFATFFCFCNLFRIGTRKEVFWVATAVGSFALAMLAGAPPYPAVLAVTVPTALIAVFWSARAGQYNGIGHRSVRSFFDPSAPPTFDLERFVRAQADGVAQQALSQVVAGRKVGHWIWFVAPNAEGLGTSFYARNYAIGSMQEARAYLAHPVLGPRLVAFAEALLSVEGRTAGEIFRDPDDRKVCSCMTLFLHAGDGQVFAQVLDKFYGGREDEQTLAIVRTWGRRRREWWRRPGE